MNEIPSEMLRGHIDTIILLCLIDGDMHTNQIKEEIERRAGGDFQLKQGTFYSALQRIVKQGYVKEYRTSDTLDGVRRKFYQLTEKGKIYIDENKDKWTYSREMINVLIETPRSETQKISVSKPQEEHQDAIIATTTAQEDESSPEQALNDFLNAQISNETTETAVIKTETEEYNEEYNKEKQTKQSKKQIKEKSQYGYDIFNLIDYTQSEYFEETETKTETAVEEQSIQESAPSQKIEIEQVIEKAVEKFIERIEEKSEDQNATTQANNVETEQNKPTTNLVETASVQETKQENIAPENDDAYSGESPVTQDYKTILAKIFDDEKPKEQLQNNDREIIYQEGLDLNGILIGSTDTAEDKIHHSKHVKKDKRKQQKTVIYEDTTEAVERHEVVNHPYYDFSDIQSMADEEGFKIKISSSERKQDGGRILINKLLFHSAISFFALILVEWLIVYFATKDIAQLSFAPFAIFLGIMAIMPIYTGIMYIINKDKRVNKVSSFKSALELMAIIMLNLILIEIVCCVLANLDFSNQVLVVRYVVYPIFFVINLPIYLFIKYLKLDKNNYYM